MREASGNSARSLFVNVASTDSVRRMTEEAYAHVLAVVGYDIEATGKKDKYGQFNKTMQECQMRAAMDWATFQTNCEFEFGASGSALFRMRDNRMTLFGVLSGDHHDKDCCPKGGCEFKAGRWSSVYVTLKGEFKDRLLTVVSQSAAR